MDGTSVQAARGLRLLRTVSGAALGLVAVAVVVRALVVPPAPGVPWDPWLELVGFVAAAVLAWVGAVGSRRLHDVVLAVGLTCYAGGWVYWYVALRAAEEQPFPSTADGLWLTFYFLVITGLGIEGRPGRGMRWAFSLDVLVGSAGAAAAVSAFLLPPLLGQGQSWQTVVVNTLYLAADTVVLLLGVSLLTVRRFRAPARWWLRLAGVTVFIVTDSLFVGTIADTGAYPESAGMYAAWMVAAGLVAVSVAGPQDRGEGHVADGAILLVPLAGAVVAVVVLAGDTVGRPVRWLAAAAVVLAVGRMGVAFHQVRALADSRRLAVTDELTGLGNRRGFHTTVRESLASDGSTTVLLLDLDGFKEVNDTLGHAAGDVLLTLVARRFAATARRGEDRRADVVARLGGDEFAVLLEGLSIAEARDAAERMLRAVSTVYTVDGIDVRVTASGGVVRADGADVDVDELLRRADVAMYAAKAGRLGVALYRPELDTRTRDGLRRVESLRAALDDGRVVLHFQPKVDLRTGRLTGVEALARIDDPVEGLIFPDRFLGALAQAGAMPTLTTQVLDAAVAQARRWHDQGRPTAVAVNVPADACVDGSLVDLVRRVLERHGVAGQLLTLEVTEEVLLQDHVLGRAVLGALRGLGVRIAIDDYGTGYSSLAYLLDLPLDELKLDRAFVRAMGEDPRAAAIVASTASLAHSLGLRVVAEGVETDDEWAAVREAGCDDAQGYLRGRPVPAAEIEELLAAGVLRG